jgi:hypothetical protein
MLAVARRMSSQVEWIEGKADCNAPHCQRCHSKPLLLA